MERGIRYEDECEVEERLVVSELDRRMDGEKWSMREEALAKKERVPGRESTTLWWVSHGSNARKLCLMP